MRPLLRWFELLLTFAGLLVTVAIPALFPTLTHSAWKTAAFTAAIVATIHGVIFFLVRSRQRLVREEALAEVRGMLQDVGNNQLTIITLLAEDHTLEPKRFAEATMQVVQSIRVMLESIGEESLQRWKEAHAGSLRDLHGPRN